MCRSCDEQRRCRIRTREPPGSNKSNKRQQQVLAVREGFSLSGVSPPNFWSQSLLEVKQEERRLRVRADKMASSRHPCCALLSSLVFLHTM